MSLRFWIKTVFHRFTPGGFGYYRKLRSLKNSDYVHERDKHPVRHKHYGDQGWQSGDGKFLYRDYGDYEEYLVHQRQKFDEILKIAGGFSNKEVMHSRLRFFRRFHHLPEFLPKDALIVCAGARQGTEVEVLRDLGFHNAYGIDINPGPDNPLVRVGDFLHMDEAAGSVDLLYTNCVDHAFNLEDLFAEHARVVKPRGYALYDIGWSAHSNQSGAGPFEAVAWERDEELLLLMLRHFQAVLKVETEPGWKWMLLQGT